MFGKIVLLVALFSMIIFTGCQVPEQEFCCRNFREDTGNTDYFWSDDSNCGIPDGVYCAGSCPSVRNRTLCR